ncbi:MAG: glycerophosphodiester phosphodiesterase family protein, partial [Actinomycetota bacterium]
MAGPHPYLDVAHPLALAHQGGGKEGVENTWPAFERAVELGYRYIETDTQVTADGVLVAFHDDTLDRITDRSGRVSDLSWSEVSTARTTPGGHELVRLDELLERWPEVRFNIDVKTRAALEPTMALVERLGRHDTVCLASFSDLTVRRLRRDDRVCTNVGRIATAIIRVCSLLPIRPPVLFGGDCAQVPVKQWFVPVADRRFIAACHRAGLPVHVWTVDDADEIRRLLDLGADGIITDRPSVLREVLEERG